MQERIVLVRKLTDPVVETDLEPSTPVQRLEMMWQLAVDAWAFKGESLAESGLPRHVVRIVRRTPPGSGRCHLA